MSDQNQDTSYPSIIIPVIVLCILLASLIPVRHWNFQLFSLLNGLHSPLTDRVWLSFTTMGDGMLVGIVLGCFLLINPRVTYVGLLVMFISSLLLHTIKITYPVPRPVEVLATVHVVGPVLRWNSFPSGHTASAVSAALAVAAFVPGRIRVGCALLVAALVAYSRISVGAHFPLDIVGGAICALVVFLVLRLFAWRSIMDRIPDRPVFSFRSFRLLLALEVCAAVFSLFVYAPCYAESPPAAAVIAVGVLVFLAVGYGKYREA